MTDTQLIDYMVEEYHNNLKDYQSMNRYYKGDHDINYDYTKFPNRAANIVIDNFINLFVMKKYNIVSEIHYHMLLCRAIKM